MHWFTTIWQASSCNVRHCWDEMRVIRYQHGMGFGFVAFSRRSLHTTTLLVDVSSPIDFTKLRGPKLRMWSLNSRSHQGHPTQPKANVRRKDTRMIMQNENARDLYWFANYMIYQYISWYYIILHSYASRHNLQNMISYTSLQSKCGKSPVANSSNLNGSRWFSCHWVYKMVVDVPNYKVFVAQLHNQRTIAIFFGEIHNPQFI